MKQANHGAIDNQQLVSIIERIEKLNEDTAAIAADIKEIYSEAKSAGFDPKYIRQMIVCGNIISRGQNSNPRWNATKNFFYFFQLPLRIASNYDS